MDNQTITPLKNGFIKIEQNGKQFTGINISKAGRPGLIKQDVNKEKETGWLFKNNSLIKWEQEGILEYEQHLYAVGSFFTGTMLADIFKSEKNEQLIRFHSLIKALLLLKNKEIPLKAFPPPSIIFLETGDILFLPPGISKRHQELNIERERIKKDLIFYHPDLDNEKNTSYFLGTVLYKILTGVFPFTGDTASEIHNQMRVKKLLAPGYLIPDLKPSISENIKRSLKEEKEPHLSLEEWEKEAETYLQTGFKTEIDTDDKNRIQIKGQKIKENIDRSYKTGNFFRRNWRMMAIGAVSLSVILSIFVSILGNILRPPVTIGLAPEKVIELFYYSQNTFDHDVMEDCTTDDAGKGSINEAISLFVTSRTRTAYETGFRYITHEKWQEIKDSGGTPTSDVYGIEKLVITNEEKDVFTAEYEKWTPGVQQSASQSPKPVDPEGVYIKDRLFLRDTGEYWVIYKIDNLMETRIQVSP